MITGDISRKKKTLQECIESLETLLKNSKGSDYNYQLEVGDSAFNILKKHVIALESKSEKAKIAPLPEAMECLDKAAAWNKLQRLIRREQAEEKERMEYGNYKKGYLDALDFIAKSMKTILKKEKKNGLE